MLSRYSARPSVKGPAPDGVKGVYLKRVAVRIVLPQGQQREHSDHRPCSPVAQRFAFMVARKRNVAA